jgi:hypothetical protein
MRNGDDEFNDPIDNLFDRSHLPKQGGELPSIKDEIKNHTFERIKHQEPCPRCRGTGIAFGGVCFKCKGTKTLVFKTDAASRAKGRASAQARAEVKRVEKIEAQRVWREEHKAEVAWLTAAAEHQHRNAHQGKSTWDFPISLDESLAQFGTLTDGQISAIRKCMARDAERAQTREKAKDEAPAIDVSKITQAFERARAWALEAGAEGLRWPQLNLDSFRFLDMPAKGDWAAAILVSEGDVKLGKVEAGKFIRFRACSDEQLARIITIAADPLKAAEAHGLRFSHCSCCGRELTNPESIARGIGPICAEKWFCA